MFKIFIFIFTSLLNTTFVFSDNFFPNSYEYLKANTKIYPYPFSSNKKQFPLHDEIGTNKKHVQIADTKTMKEAEDMYSKIDLHGWQAINYQQNDNIFRGWVKNDNIEKSKIKVYFHKYDTPENSFVKRIHSNIGFKSCPKNSSLMRDLFLLSNIGEENIKDSCSNYKTNFNDIDNEERERKITTGSSLNLKSSQELERYLIRNQKRDKIEGSKKKIKALDNEGLARLSRLYKTKYKHYITNSARAFNIPNSILTCMYFRESNHFSGKTSVTGAEGLAQITKITEVEINKLLNFIPEVEISRLRKVKSEEIKNLSKNKKALRIKLNEINKFSSSANKKREDQQGLLRYLKLRGSHRACEAYNSISNDKNIDENIYNEGLDLTHFSPEDTKKTEKSIVLGSYYLSSLNRRFQWRFKRAKITDKTTQYIISTLMYNMGYSKFEKFWKKELRGSSFEKEPLKNIRYALTKCVNRKKASSPKCKEVRGHLDAIKNCSEKGNKAKMHNVNWSKW